MGRLLALIFSFTIFSAHAAVLIEGGKFGHKKGQTRHRVSKTADDGIGLRDVRRVGVGFSTAGPTGLLGLNLELNFSAKTSFRTGFGLGTGYNTFHFEIRRMVSGTWFVPYMAGGFARWSGTGQNDLSESTPGYLAEKFLNTTERTTGKFVENMIYPALGIQYMQLSGDWAGSSLYAEVLMMIDMDDFVAAPSGEVGYLYYF